MWIQVRLILLLPVHLFQSQRILALWDLRLGRCMWSRSCVMGLARVAMGTMRITAPLVLMGRGLPIRLRLQRTTWGLVSVLISTTSSLMRILVSWSARLIPWRRMGIMLLGSACRIVPIIAMRTLILTFVLVIAQLPRLFRVRFYSRINSTGNVFQIAHQKLPMPRKIVVGGNALRFAPTRRILQTFSSISMQWTGSSLNVWRYARTTQASGYLDIKGTAFPDAPQELGAIHSANYARRTAREPVSCIRIAQQDSISVYSIAPVSTTIEIILLLPVFWRVQAELMERRLVNVWFDARMAPLVCLSVIEDV